MGTLPLRDRIRVVPVSINDEGVSVLLRDDRALFGNCRSLEGAQAGLSWSTILKKRPLSPGLRRLRSAPIAGYDEGKVAALLADSSYATGPRLRRHRQRRAYLALAESGAISAIGSGPSSAAPAAKCVDIPSEGAGPHIPIRRHE